MAGHHWNQRYAVHLPDHWRGALWNPLWLVRASHFVRAFRRNPIENHRTNLQIGISSEFNGISMGFLWDFRWDLNTNGNPIEILLTVTNTPAFPVIFLVNFSGKTAAQPSHF